MKKVLSVLLALVLSLSIILPVFAEGETLQDIPIITVPGTSNTQILNATGETIVPDSFEISDFLSDREKMEPLLKEFAKAIITNRWDKYCDMLVEALSPIWAPAVYNNAGEPQHGDHPTWTWTQNSIPKKTSGFREGDYYFRYDWRRDPYYSAEELDAYVDGVLNATGASKVALVGRCYGACVVSAYLDKYGSDKVDNCIMYMPMVTGVETEQAVFTGAIKLDADTVQMYVNNWLNEERPISDDDLTDLVAALVTIVYYTGGLHLTAKTLDRLIGKFKDNILPRLIRASYGSYPGYWAMIGDEVYEEAKQYVFGGVEDQYAQLIETADRYHYNVQTPLFDTLDALQESGMKLTVIAKYGFPTYPYFEGSDYLTDSSNSIYKQSFGATASTINTVLSESYRNSVIEAGNGIYLSADRKVDASTCRYPDRTWFFKDIKHLEMHGYISDLMTYSTQVTEQLTVFDDARYPQFMHKDLDGNVVPLTSDDPSDLKWQRVNPFVALRNFLKSFLNVIKNFLSSQFSK